MDKHDELLHAILASPDDDAPRLVYADWLLEHGDELDRAQGELIEVQCALARLDDRPLVDRAPLVRRAARLVAEFRAGWSEALVPGWGKKVAAQELEIEMERGFVASAGVGTIGTPFMIRSWNLLQDLKTAVTRGPLTRLEIGCVGLDLQSIFEEPAIARLRALKLSIRWLERRAPMPSESCASLRRLCLRLGAETELDELAPIVGSPHLAHLEDLAIETREELAPIVTTLAESPCAPSLRSLSLAGRSLGDVGLARLLSGAFDGVESLSLRVDDVGEIVRAIVNRSCFPALRELRLSPASKAWRSSDALPILGARPAIDVLHLGGGDASTSWSLLERAELGRLRGLGLTRHGLDDDDVRALAAERRLSGLCALDLAGNEIHDDGVRAIASATHLASLRSLSLASNPFDGGAWLARAAHLDGLEELDLRSATSRIEATEILLAHFGASVRLGSPAWYHEDD